MNCHEAQALLSAYYDHELSVQQAAAVRSHIEQCDDCARELAAFRALSGFATSLDDAAASAKSWETLSQSLSSAVKPAKVQPPQFRRQLLTVTAVALGLLICAGIGLSWWRSAAQHRSVAGVFDTYLERFPEDAVEAQQILLAAYDGQQVTSRQAADAVGYMPIANARVPAGYKLEGTHLLRMPCCRCPQTLYCRCDGHRLAIFEHEDDCGRWFGGRPLIACRCQGQPASLVQIQGQQLAADWQQNSRRITLIGADSIEEVARIMAEFKLQ
jgi:anti-sigma factor RsiW